MLYNNVTKNVLQTVLRRTVTKRCSACQLFLCDKFHLSSRPALIQRFPRLRPVVVQRGSKEQRILQEVDSNDDSSQHVGTREFMSIVRKLLSPVLTVLRSNRIRSMYAELSLDPPEDVRGMKTLNVDAFRKVVLVPGLRVPNQHTGLAVNKLKGYLLKMPGIKPVAEVKGSDPESHTHKLFLLEPGKVKDIDAFIKEQEEFFKACHIDKDSVKLYELELGYKNWTHHDILRAILPQEHDGVAGFSTIGHILHLNLRNDIMDYKYIIGRVLLDKIPTARTVVNKLDVIDNTFRNFEMEVLAGDNDFVAVTKENGFSYKLDFSKVYWNPRLGTEHQRIVSLLQPHDVVFDVFAGVGPFAVPAAKKRCTVYANDLNPHSYRWLQENMTLNKVKGDYQIFNMDGREFIRSVVKEKLVHHWNQSEKDVQYHIIMNLPAMAVHFLDAFRGLFAKFRADQRKNWPSYKEPSVYCYAFTKAEDGKKDVVEQAENHLGSSLGDDYVVRFVRQVAPNKDMFCVAFKPSSELLFDSTRDQHVADTEPPAKKLKTGC